MQDSSALPLVPHSLFSMFNSGFLVFLVFFPYFYTTRFNCFYLFLPQLPHFWIWPIDFLLWKGRIFNFYYWHGTVLHSAPYSLPPPKCFPFSLLKVLSPYVGLSQYSMFTLLGLCNYYLRRATCNTMIIVSCIYNFQFSQKLIITHFFSFVLFYVYQLPVIFQTPWQQWKSLNILNPAPSNLFYLLIFQNALKSLQPPAAVQTVLWKQHPDSYSNFPSTSPEQPLHPEYHCVFFLGFPPSSGGIRLPVTSWQRGLGGKFLETLFVWKCFCSSLTFD